MNIIENQNVEFLPLGTVECETVITNVEREDETPIKSDNNELRAFCCEEYFEHLGNLLHHMELFHYELLRSCILSKRDLIMKCLKSERKPVKNAQNVEKQRKSKVMTHQSHEMMKKEHEKTENVIVKIEPSRLMRSKSKRSETIDNNNAECELNDEFQGDEKVGCDISVPKWKRMKKKPDDDRRFECSTCQKICIGLRELQNHEKRHLGNYICDFCGLGFFFKEKLQAHFFSHKMKALKNPELACAMCELIFDNQFEVEAHRLEFHVTKLGETFDCDQCSEKLLTKFNLMVHVRKYHPPNKKLECKFCYKRFKTKEDREKHIQEHEQNLLEILCTCCGKTFKGAKRLKKHLHTRDKQRNFFCSVCNKGFISQRRVEIHEINSHGLGEAPFKCTSCGKGYAKHGDLKNHEVMHSDIKPFQCKDCPMAFRKSGHLKSHIISRHTKPEDLPPVFCLLCSQQVKTKDILRSHLRKVHKITMNEMYKQVGVPYNGRDILSSKLIQNRKTQDIKL